MRIDFFDPNILIYKIRTFLNLILKESTKLINNIQFPLKIKASLHADFFIPVIVKVYLAALKTISCANTVEYQTQNIYRSVVGLKLTFFLIDNEA